MPAAVRAGHAMRMLYVGAANSASNLFLQDDWWAVIGAEQMRVITETLGTNGANSPVAWVVFQEAEYRRTGVSDYSSSGMPGPLTHLAAVGGVATPTPMCDTAVLATVQASSGGYSPPHPCVQAIGTPGVAESRNTLYYPVGSVVKINLADTWQYSGQVTTTLSVNVRYRNSEAGTISLRYVNGAGAVSTQAITKTGAGGWATATYSLPMRTTNRRPRSSLRRAGTRSSRTCPSAAPRC